MSFALILHINYVRVGIAYNEKQAIYHSKNTYEIRLEICTGFVAVSNETATTTLWPLVIATVAVRTAVGHLLNGHNAVGAIAYTVFYAVFPY